MKVFAFSTGLLAKEQNLGIDLNFHRRSLNKVEFFKYLAN